LRLHLHEWGAGSTTIVCLHGVTAHGGHFGPLAGRLPGFRVIAPDLRGHGRSGWEPPWGIETHLADVLETVEPVGVGRAVWVGHSFGGRLVIELAARHPARVERAVLLDPAIRIRPDLALAAADDARADRIFASPAEAVTPQHGGRLFRTPPELVEEERERHLEPVGDGYRWRFSRSAVVAMLGELAAWGPRPEQLCAPVLLVVGSEESVVGPRQLDRFRRALGDRLKVVHVPGGHVVLWDAFVETASAVTAFVEAA
jgi:lipase